MLKIKNLTESLERKYLTEKVNPENDEVNTAIRRNVGKKLRDISPEDRELLANNGISVSGDKDNRTYSTKDNRSMTFNKNGRTKEYSTHWFGKPSRPDVNNPDFDLKGWLSTDKKGRLYGAQYKPSDEYKRVKSYADDAEKRGRRYRKDLEAQVQNSILNNDDYYPHIDYEGRDRAIRGDYEWADRLNDKAKKIASDAKARSKYYKNESLKEAYEYELERDIDEIMDDDSLSKEEKKILVAELFASYGMNESLNESISLKDAIRDEIDHKRSLGYSDEELSQAEILENILYDDSHDLAEDEKSWLEDILSSLFMDRNKKVAIVDLFRSIGEYDIPFDLGEEDIEESLNEEKTFRYLEPDFDINSIENELDKRYNSLQYLLDNRYDVEDHYIHRFNFDLAMIRKMLKEDIESLDFTDEIAVKSFFDDLDSRIHHAEGYIGLPG